MSLLLDKDNKVVAIGNPIHNLKVKELRCSGCSSSVAFKYKYKNL